MPENLMACPVCGEEVVEFFAHAYDKEYFTSDEKYTYVRCPTCTSVYLHEPPADRLDFIYPPNYYSYGHVEDSTALTERVKRRLDRRMLRKVFDSIPGDNLRVLDVGGGSGWSLTVAREACDRVAETHEVDLQEAAAALAEKAGHVYHCGPIEEFHSDDKFDLIMMMSIIEHVPDPAKVMGRMRDLLSDNGILLIKTPNTDTLDARIFRNRNWGGLHCPRHFVLFTERGLGMLGDKCGLRMVDSYYTQGAPQWAIGVMGLMHDRRLIKMTPERPAYQHPVYEPLTALFAAFDFARAPFAPTAQMMVSFSRS
ncbi:class I SAM-dependent methyltransferase [Streptomyces clavifer]|uniref:class I SAM-dependent methyltransferase n=1 Tax=Streptomyces clavifer TaxID=68188 RepID=UPI003697BD82